MNAENVAVLGKRGAGRGGDVEIAGGVDHHVAHDRLAALFALDDDAADARVMDNRAGERRMQAEVDAGLQHHVVAGAFPTIRIEGDGVTNSNT